MESPIVSICCITYNHAPFIRKALDGFLMQEPPMGWDKDEPWYEILIHDDASTDGTTEIIKEYAKKYPNKIFPLYEEENQYSRIGAAKIDLFNYNRARGKYIAYCEGDDYWIDPKKLQRQIAVMEANPKLSVCFHRVYLCLEDGTLREDEVDSFTQGKDQTIIKCDDIFDNHIVQPLSMFFRVSMLDKSKMDYYQYYRDTHEIYHLLKNGDGVFLNFFGGVYCRHSNGVASTINTHEKYYDELFCVHRELYYKTKVYKDKGPRKLYTYVLDNAIRVCLKRKEKMKAIQYCIERGIVTKNFKHCLYTIFCVIVNKA